MLDEEVGQGLPVWLPKGAYVRHKIKEFAFNTYLKNGYLPVVGPHISTEALWSHSGHLDFYQENMYNAFGIDKEKYRLKPMNCPIHVKIYNRKPHSYRELPIRYTEMGTVYRYEKSGVLHGLTRVRGFTQDDAHIICTEDQLHSELVKALELTLYILKTFAFVDFEMNVSVRDPKNKTNYAGDDKGWTMAETAITKALKAVNFNNYVYDVGGAVFYGPKIDIKIKDSIGRQWQLSTIQIDFNLPGRFKMTYLDKDQKEKTPFMIHRALLGSLERFMGVYIEHTAGAFPLWLSPTQVGILPVSEKFNDLASKIEAKLLEAGIRCSVNSDNKPLGAKIREESLQKTPYLCIIGNNELGLSSADKTYVSVRRRDGHNLGQLLLNEFIKVLKEQIEKKT
jgi:threonyl-tRNA synthetase